MENDIVSMFQSGVDVDSIVNHIYKITQSSYWKSRVDYTGLKQNCNKTDCRIFVYKVLLQRVFAIDNVSTYGFYKK